MMTPSQKKTLANALDEWAEQWDILAPRVRKVQDSFQRQGFQREEALGLTKIATRGMLERMKDA